MHIYISYISYIPNIYIYITYISNIYQIYIYTIFIYAYMMNIYIHMNIYIYVCEQSNPCSGSVLGVSKVLVLLAVNDTNAT